MLLSPERSYERKIKEIILAYRLENYLSKDEILARYLSNVYFGDNVYGLRAAALAITFADEQPAATPLGETTLAAYRRAAGQAPADAPLVEAPFFMDPPRDRKGMPMHYAPKRRLPFPVPPIPAPPIPKVIAERAGSLVHTTFSLTGLRPARGRRPAA